MKQETVDGITAGVTRQPKRRVTREEANPILRGLTDSRVEADVDSRAIKSLSTGDPRGLEMLDFGSVRGKPAVAFKAPDGSRQVMMVSMPTYLASLKARTTGRQKMRQKIEEDMKRKALQNEMAPKFQTALEQVSVSQGPLFAPLMASMFERDPEGAALLVNDVIKLERRKPKEAFALAQNAVKSETLRMAGAQQSKVRNFIKSRLSSMKKNADDSKQPDRPTQRTESDLQGRLYGNITAAMDTIIGDRPENYGMSLSQRVDMDPQFANLILEDLYTTLSAGTYLPSGGHIKLEKVTGEGSSLKAYINTWSRALQEMGYTQPLTQDDVILLNELALRKQGNEASGAAAQMHIDKLVEGMSQPAPNDKMPFGVDKKSPATSDNDRQTFIREAAEILGTTEDDIQRRLQADPEQLVQELLPHASNADEF